MQCGQLHCPLCVCASLSSFIASCRSKELSLLAAVLATEHGAFISLRWSEWVRVCALWPCTATSVVSQKKREPLQFNACQSSTSLNGATSVSVAPGVCSSNSFLYRHSFLSVELLKKYLSLRLLRCSEWPRSHQTDRLTLPVACWSVFLAQCHCRSSLGHSIEIATVHTHTHTGFLFFFFVVATTKCKFWPWYGVGHLVWWWWWPHLPKVGAKGESTEKDSQRPRPLRSLLRLWSKHSDDAADAVLGHSIRSITYQS